MAERFNGYDVHYGRTGNSIPNWELAETNPAKFAFREPWLPSNKEAHMLDIGCGWGTKLLALWCAGYHAIEGVELTPEMAQIANEAANGRIKIYCEDGASYLQSKVAEYDVIMLYSVLEHMSVPDGMKLLDLIYRALRPGGRVVIFVPNMANLLATFTHFGDITHIVGYTEYSIQQVLDQVGFENHVFVSYLSTINLRKWRPWRPWIGLGIRPRLNHLLHKALYWMTGISPRPVQFGPNLYLFSHKIS